MLPRAEADRRISAGGEMRVTERPLATKNCSVASLGRWWVIPGGAFAWLLAPMLWAQDRGNRRHRRRVANQADRGAGPGARRQMAGPERVGCGRPKLLPIPLGRRHPRTERCPDRSNPDRPRPGHRSLVGLYLNPPDKAAVLCIDEKSQIQALDRTQPGLPIKPGKAGTMTHDYKRHGTVNLYAALNILDGTVVGECLPRHRHQEFLRFLRRLDRQFPRGLDLHLVLDNSSTHSTPEVKAWLDGHRRFKLHFVPTSSSWLNMVEAVFADLTKKRLRRGSFASIDELSEAIVDYLDHRNGDPKPFVWSASAESILAKLRGCKAIIETIR
jgi:transposase